MLNHTRHLHSALQPLLTSALALDPSDRQAWMDELHADCPTVARELEQLMRPLLKSSAVS